MDKNFIFILIDEVSSVKTHYINLEGKKIYKLLEENSLFTHFEN